MSLILALALPPARQPRTSIISGKLGDAEKLPADLMAAFHTEVFQSAATQQATLERIEAKLDESMDQDFKRDYLSALTTLEDSARARSVYELEVGLKQAWDLLVHTNSAAQDSSARIVLPSVPGVTTRWRPHGAVRSRHKRKARQLSSISIKAAALFVCPCP